MKDDTKDFHKFAAAHLSTLTIILGFVSGLAVMGSIWAINDASRTKTESIAKADEAIEISRKNADLIFRQYELVMVYVRGIDADLKVAGFQPPELPKTEERPE